MFSAIFLSLIATASPRLECILGDRFQAGLYPGAVTTASPTRDGNQVEVNYGEVSTRYFVHQGKVGDVFHVFDSQQRSYLERKIRECLNSPPRYQTTTLAVWDTPNFELRLTSVPKVMIVLSAFRSAESQLRISWPNDSSTVELAPLYSDSKVTGALVTAVDGASGYARMGLRVGDVVSKWNEEPIKRENDLHRILTLAIGDSLTIDREGTLKKLVLAESHLRSGECFRAEKLTIELDTVTKPTPSESYSKVKSINVLGPYSSLRMRSGDIIRSVNGNPVTEQRTLLCLNPGDRIEYERGGETKTTQYLPISEQP